MKRTCAGALLLVMACAETAVPPKGVHLTDPATTAQLTEGAPLAAETVRRFPSGAEVHIPKGWRLVEHGGSYLIHDPERAIQLTLTEIDAESVDTARIRALADLKSTAFGKVQDEKRVGAGQSEWDEAVQATYVAPVDNIRIINVRRIGRINLVALWSGQESAILRRSPQLSAMIFGLRPAALDEEDLRRKVATWSPEKSLELIGFAEHARETLHVPGAAFAVLVDGAIALEQPLGKKALGDPQPVTTSTRFLLGSVTKMLTSVAVANLVSEGLFTWDTQITDLYQGFRLGTKGATEELTIARTLCSCVALPRHDLELLFEYQKAKPESQIRGLSTLVPTSAFGEAFQYSNAMVSLGGYAAANAWHPKAPLAASFAALLDEKVFAKVGMTGATLNFDSALAGDHAMPHQTDATGTLQVLEPNLERFVTPEAPAAGAWATAHDLALFAATEIAGGKTANGNRLASEQVYNARYASRVSAGKQATYGLGVMVAHANGLTFHEHGGGTFGMASLLSVSPEKRVGIVVLTNAANGGSLASVIEQRFLELAFGARPKAARVLAFAEAERERRLKDAAEQLPIGKVTETSELHALEGIYTDPLLGTLTLRLRDHELIADAGEWRSRMVRARSGGTLILLDPPVAGLRIEPEPENKLTLVVGDKTYSFEKRLR